MRLLAVVLVVITVVAAFGVLHYTIVHPLRGTPVSNLFAGTCALCHGDAYTDFEADTAE
jgi:uncharacterized membrane protein